MPLTPPLNTYPSSNVSLKEKAANIYSTFNFPFTAVTQIRYGFTLASAVIGRRALLVFSYDVRQPFVGWRNLSDAYPFYENGAIQYGFNKLTPVKYYCLNNPDNVNSVWSVVEVAENIGDDAGYFGLAFDTTANAYDSLLIYNISYPKKDMFNIYPDSTNGDTLYIKYGRLDSYNQILFSAYRGGEGEYDSPFFDKNFHLHGIRWSSQDNYFIGRKGFYFLKYVIDSLATDVAEISSNNSFGIYPNPAAQNIFIQFNEPLKSNASLIISNVLGQAIATRQLSMGEINAEEDVSQLPNGIYAVTIKDILGVGNRKFIKE